MRVMRRRLPSGDHCRCCLKEPSRVRRTTLGSPAGAAAPARKNTINNTSKRICVDRGFEDSPPAIGGRPSGATGIGRDALAASFPDVSLIEWYVMCNQKLAELVLERDPTVVQLLTRDVLSHDGDLGMADAKCTVADLPREFAKPRIFIVNPTAR